MFYRGLILINNYSYSEEVKYQTKRLTEEFKRLNVEIEVKKANLLLGYISDQIVCNLKGYDFIIYLDKDKYLLEIIKTTNIRIFNSPKVINICDDKLLTHLALSDQGIRMPKTYSSPLCYVDANFDQQLLDEVVNNLGYPLVIKEAHGSKGKQVYLVNNQKELQELSNQLISKPFLFQEFIKSSCGKDMRVIVINKKAVAWMLRESKNDFRSNVGIEGSGSVVNLPPTFKEMAENVASTLNMDYGGIDILFSEDDQPILCEVNSNAFFTEIEKTTNVNIGGLYAEYIYQTIYKK